MNRSISRRLFTLFLGCTAVASGRGKTRCNVCGGRLSKQHWIYEGKPCCSQSCIDQLRPRCTACNKLITKNYVTSKEKTYCSNACFETTLPKCELCKTPIHNGFSITRHRYCKTCANDTPSCFSCGLPAAYPTQLPDGRTICNTCMRWSVTTQEMAEKHYDRARRNLEAWTSLKLESVPKLELVDRAAMQVLSKKIRKTDTPISIRGLYSRQTFMRKRGIFGTWKESPADAKETIYIVDHLHDEVFRVAAVHEFMHDLIHEHFQRLVQAPLWVHEGICQRAAAEYCKRRNYTDTLHGIEMCADPDYGDGYKFFDSISEFEGWSALRRWMETVDVEALPKTAPAPKQPRY